MKTIKEILLDQQTTIIDVRNDWEYDSGHVDGALNIAVHDLPGRLDELRNMKGPIVVYCQSGGRSGMAQQFLQQNGFNDVHNGGGIGQMRILTL
jgi:phage shock protein E